MSELDFLIEDLWLVPSGSPESKSYLYALKNSRYTRYPLCARYKDFLKDKKLMRDILCRELYLRNRKYSCHVFASYSD